MVFIKNDNFCGNLACVGRGIVVFLSKMTTFNHLAEQLRQRRKELNISQFELAALTGIGVATLNRIESGKHIPGLRTLLPLADALGLKLTLQPKQS